MDNIIICEDSMKKMCSYLDHDETAILLASRSETGKTTLAANIAKYESEYNNKHIMFFEMDCSEKQLHDKYGLSQSGKIKLYFPEDTYSIYKIADILAGEFVKNSNLKEVLVIIDYMQLINYYKYEDSFASKMTETSIILKKMTKAFGVKILVLCQFPNDMVYRGYNGEWPCLSDLRFAGSIGQDYDIILFLNRKSYDNSSCFDPIIECNVAKNRYGDRDFVFPLKCSYNYSKAEITYDLSKYGTQGLIDLHQIK